ncbi:metallophosphatase domain-containing protein [Sphingosinicella sp. BN140058]|uniref:metallophosphatase domain-containing protein n=1 Tax=Sphingosinicella sp. BN140058 TaxID=1892855 RepID=UPI0013ECDD73|nr:metallophosphatase domain-containing protein [Sphingosinicella sp. BN140058]
MRRCAALEPELPLHSFTGTMLQRDDAMRLLDRLLRFAPALPHRHRRRTGEVRVTVISDTHCLHDALRLPAGDLLIHCGDMFDLSRREGGDLARMDDWFGKQPFERILCTGGNHDQILEQARASNPQPFRNAHYLEDEMLHYRGLRIYGAPWVPGLPTHAFPKTRSALAEAWARIPNEIDILVTHTPPRNVLDRSTRGTSFGCPELAEAVRRTAPRIHCFGHVHAGAGQTARDGTLFINASSVRSAGGALRAPISFTLVPRA